MKAKHFAIIAVVAVMVLSVSAFSNFSVAQVYTKDNMIDMGFNNFVCVEKNGEFVACSPNTVTGRGLNNTRDSLMTTDTLEEWKTLTLSDGATGPAQGDAVCEATIVTGNGLASANGTLAIANIGNFTITKTWTASGTETGIAKVCVFNGTGNEIMASALISPTVNMGANDNLTVTYYIVVS